MSRRTLSPEDPRLRQVADMRKRGLTQVEMARALGASQQTVSRLARYIDSLTADQLTRIEREREPNSLAAMIRRSDERRKILDQIYHAYHRGEDISGLWARANALTPRNTPAVGISRPAITREPQPAEATTAQ